MRKFNITTIIVLFTIFASAVYAQTETGTITVKVTQIDVKEVGKEVLGVDLVVTKALVTYTFKDIPIGQYAIAVFQDENNDGKLSKNLFGAPKEPYGFSKNIYGMFGSPDFDDVSFALKDKEAISLTINLE